MELLYENNRVEIYFDKSKNILVQNWKDQNSRNLPMERKNNYALIKSAEDLERLLYFNESNTIFHSKFQVMFLQWYAFRIPRA